MTPLEFTIPVGPMAKARPRITRRGTYMPDHYTAWRRAFTAHCLDQGVPDVVGPFAIGVIFQTKNGRMRPDLDNAIGAVLDALQDAGIIANDSACDQLAAAKRKGKTPAIIITLTPLTEGETP